MKFLVRLILVASLIAEAASAQQARRTPATPLLTPKTAELPTPAGAPEPQFSSDLLPESTVLPAAPLDRRLWSPSGLPLGTDAAESEQPVKPLSPEEKLKNRLRLNEIRAIAMRNQRVIALQRMADGALSDEAKREFMRAYYFTLCTRMRALDHALTGTINEYERTQIRQLAKGPSRMAIASRETQRRERLKRAKRAE